MEAELICSDALLLALSEDPDSVRLDWHGKSTAREPAKVIVGALQKAIDLASDHKKILVLDFRAVEFMNSSSITPLIRVLHKAQRSFVAVQVVYKKDLKWQMLIFSALEVFQTTDRRVVVMGA